MCDPVPESGPSTALAVPSMDIAALWSPPNDDASRAMRFVRLCGRVTLTSAVAAQLREISATLSETDWNQVLFAASAGGLAPLVFRHAAQVGLLAAMPASVASGLGDAYRQTLVTNRGLRREQDALLAACAARGVTVVALKGIALAERYYHEVALRPIHDIDLLVRPQDVRRVGRILKALGYEPLRGHTRLGNFVALLGADLSYARAGGAMVEIHWELTHRPAYRRSLAARGALRRSEAGEPRGHVVRRLSVADELRFLCVHCTVDHPVTSVGIRLIWLVDIAELVRALPSDWDWPAFVQETIALRLAAPLAVALTHCQTLLDLELPPEALETLRAAAAAPHERSAWRLAQTDFFSADGLSAHLGAMHGVVDFVTFARGILLPYPAWIRKHYCHRGGLALPLWRGYASYYSRLVVRFPELLAAGGRWRPRGGRSAR
jgi:hypothetical protein